MPLAWAQHLNGEASPLWRQVPATNPLSGRSVVLQPAERSVRGALESHLGWLARDCQARIARARRMLAFKARGDEEKLQAVEHFFHACFAINRAKAWTKTGADRNKLVMKLADGKSVPGPERAYRFCKKEFLLLSQLRHLPDASRFQIEASRDGARLRATEAELPEALAGELGLSLESSLSKDSQAFPYWLRMAVHDSSGDASAPRQTSILLPARACRSFDIRNAGSLAPGAGSSAPTPTRSTRKAKWDPEASGKSGFARTCSPRP